MPVPGIDTPDPKEYPRVYVLDTAFPSSSIIEKWGVSFDSFQTLSGLTAEDGVAFLKLIFRANCFVLSLDKKFSIGVL